MATVYKLTCLLTGETYVGSTIRGVVPRVRSHRAQRKLYKVHRHFAQVGWAACQPSVLEDVSDVSQRFIRERHWYDELSPTLNMIRPILTEYERRHYRKHCRYETLLKARRNDRMYHYSHREERNAYYRAYHNKNKIKVQLYWRTYRQEHRERLNAISNAYYDAHRAEQCAKQRMYTAKNKDIIAAKDKIRKAAYRATHQDELNAKAREKYAANREAIAEKNRIKAPCPVCGKVITKCNTTAHIKRMHQAAPSSPAGSA